MLIIVNTKDTNFYKCAVKNTTEKTKGSLLKQCNTIKKYINSYTGGDIGEQVFKLLPLQEIISHLD